MIVPEKLIVVASSSVKLLLSAEGAHEATSTFAARAMARRLIHEDLKPMNSGGILGPQKGYRLFSLGKSAPDNHKKKSIKCILLKEWAAIFMIIFTKINRN